MAFRAYRGDVREKIKKEFCKESLFRFMYRRLYDKVLKDKREALNFDYSIVEVWEDAKEFVKKLSESPYPDIEIIDLWNMAIDHKYFCYDATPRKSMLQPIVVDQYELDYYERQPIFNCFVTCVYSMFLITMLKREADDSLFLKPCVKLIYSYVLYEFDDLLDEIQENLSDKLIVFDYDYWVDDTVAENDAQLESADTDTVNDSPQDEDRDNEDESTTVITGKKGQTRTHHITAKQAGELTTDFIQMGNKQKSDWCRFVSQLTGISTNTLKDHVRME